MISQRDIKLLWGRSGARCALCRSHLAHDKEHATGAFHLGEHAHIVAAESDGPRGTSPLSGAERDSYPNLILLCPTCHSRIDTGEPESYPVERLHHIKTTHELWVQSQLSSPSDLREDVAGDIYASLIDAAVSSCDLANWHRWVSAAYSAYQFWPLDAPDRIRAFRLRLVVASWPGTLPELEQALKTLAFAVQEALDQFLKHAREQDGSLRAEYFYHHAGDDPTEYRRLFEDFQRWQDECGWWLNEATKAANWLAEEVRAHINPRFFALEGRFGYTVDYGLSAYTYVSEYHIKERQRALQKLAAHAKRTRREPRT
jgi:hypothetical protein